MFQYEQKNLHVIFVYFLGFKQKEMTMVVK